MNSLRQLSLRAWSPHRRRRSPPTSQARARRSRSRSIEWADAYKKENRQRSELSVDRLRRRHQRQIQAKTVRSAPPTPPLKAEQLEKDGLVQWPMVMGAIVRS